MVELEKRTGGCRCKAVRFSVSGAPLGGIACHCRDCQYVAGGAPNLSWIFEAKLFEVEMGQPRQYNASVGSGGSFFCAECGVQLYSIPDSNRHLVAVKVGAFDDASGFSVAADMWMSSAPQWHRPHDGALQFEKNMPATSE